MQRAIIIVLVALTAVALAEGQYYVPRAYYTIDTDGHASAPVPLRRLRRSYNPLPYVRGSANANANAWSEGGGDANANANAHSGGDWGAPPRGAYGAANPKRLGPGQSYRSAGLVSGRSVTATSNVGVDSTGSGYYEQETSVI